jgi:outer membrane protein TolC
MRKSIVFLLGIPLCAQEALSLRDAVSLALRENRSIAGAAAAVRACESQAAQARAGMRPKVDYSESFARSDNPVFVFSSLLAQHQFSAGNFDIGPLNRPDFLNNFQSQLTVDQPLYDGGQMRNAVKAAGLRQEMAGEDRRGAEMQVIAAVARAYNGAVLAAESLAAAEQAVRSAEADLERAESRRAAGMATDADVLSIRVHRAAMAEQRIDRAADLEVAKAALNDALGLPLDTPHTLTGKLTPLDVPEMALDGLEKSAGDARPEARKLRLASQLAQSQADSARDALLPRVDFHGVFEADRQRFVTRGGADWTAAVSFRWNLFNGLADKARIAESSHWMERAKDEERRADSAVRLEVRRAYASLQAAQQRIEVAKASMAEADESLRITRNRYEAGMAGVTDLLHNETAVLESRTRYLAAVHDQRTAAVMVEFAAGKLTAASEVLQ